MAKTIHFRKGCKWADGSIQQADTRQVSFWEFVTCGACKRSYGREERAKMHDWNPDKDEPKEEWKEKLWDWDLDCLPARTRKHYKLRGNPFRKKAKRRAR